MENKGNFVNCCSMWHLWSTLVCVIQSKLMFVSSLWQLIIVVSFLLFYATFITSSKELCFIRRFSSSLCMCLSVCLVATSRKNYSSNLHEFFFRNLLWTRKNLLNSGGHPHLDQTLGIFLKDSSTLRDRICFHNSAHFSGKLDGIFTKIFITDRPLSMDLWC